MKNNFESFLQDQFMEDFTGVKDQFEDAYESWLMDIDIQEIIDWADVYANSCYLEGLKN